MLKLVNKIKHTCNILIELCLLNFPLQVIRLMERVEKAFIKHFSNSNRNNGLNLLRPKPNRARHRITFSMGENQDLI